jgi:glycosyltransferase involved in cell wall biosynthesis
MSRGGRQRILFCENNVDGTVGGSYYSLLFLVKGLDQTKYEPIVVFYSDHTLVPAFREAGAETIIWPRTIPFSFATRTTGPGRLFSPALAVVRKALNLGQALFVGAASRARFLRRRRIDLVHLNNSILVSHDWMLAARLVGTRCLTHERGINARYTGFAKYFGRRLAAIICISESVRANMQARGADFGNLVTIYNGLDPAALVRRTAPEELRRSQGLAPDTPVVVMVGNIKEWKGQDTLIRAIDHVRRRHPAVRCLLVGDTSPLDRPYEQRIRALIASLGVDAHIVFTGYQKYVADFMQMADVVVHASVAPEPFGRVILEAMACRKPVVGARAGAIPEIVDEGRTGLTFEPSNDHEFAEAISALLSDPARAQRMGEAGYERLVSHFPVSRNIDATQRVYERLFHAAD